MKQLSMYAPPLLVKATARPRRKSVILLRRIQRRVALLCVGLFALIYAPFQKPPARRLTPDIDL